MKTDIVRNQCDGCNAGMKLTNGNLHVHNGIPVMVCQKHKYESKGKKK